MGSAKKNCFVFFFHLDYHRHCVFVRRRKTLNPIEKKILIQFKMVLTTVSVISYSWHKWQKYLLVGSSQLLNPCEENVPFNKENICVTRSPGRSFSRNSQQSWARYKNWRREVSCQEQLLITAKLANTLSSLASLGCGKLVMEGS